MKNRLTSFPWILWEYSAGNQQQGTSFAWSQRGLSDQVRPELKQFGINIFDVYEWLDIPLPQGYNAPPQENKKKRQKIRAVVVAKRDVPMNNTLYKKWRERNAWKTAEI